MAKKELQATDDQEVDISAFGRKMGNAFQNLNTLIFESIQFLLRNIIIITLLLIIGVALGFYLDKTQKTYDHRIIVTPNFGSVDYLYNKIELINSKILERDTMFLKAIGIKDASKLSKIEISPIVDIYKFVNNSEQNYQVLKLMSDAGDVKRIVEERATSKNYTNHMISFSTKKVADENKIVKPLLDYLNNSAFYKQVQKEYVNNIQQKMRTNDETLAQINGFLNEFTETAANPESKNSNLVYYNENSQLNDVIKTKEDLAEEQGYHRINMVSYDKIVKEVTSILNIENTKSVNGKMKIILPLLLILLFIILNRFRSFYRRESLKQKTAI